MQYKLFLLLIVFSSSCLKRTFDSPPDSNLIDPNLPVTHNIIQLHDISDGLIEGDYTISGIVNMDDKAGNVYKKIIIQDSTGGAEILLDQSNLYTSYPVGRKIYIKLQGLYKKINSNGIQIGSTPEMPTSSVSNIPLSQIDNHITKGKYPNLLEPIHTTISNLKNIETNRHLLNKLIHLTDIQFTPDLAGSTYANVPSISSATNRRIMNCLDTNSIVLRTSGYATFQHSLLPENNGQIQAIYSAFSNTPQLLIRNTDDLDMKLDRCLPDSSILSSNIITIDSLRNIYKTSSIVLPMITITGVIISDKNHGNINNRNVIIQQGSSGIMLRFNSAHYFNMGDSIEVYLQDSSLEKYQDLLQVNNIPLIKSKKLGIGNINPKIVNIKSVIENPTLYESTLIQIENANVPTGGIFNGSKKLRDDTGEMILYTSSTALFAKDSIPTTPKTYVGIVGRYLTTIQLQIRNKEDIK